MFDGWTGVIIIAIIAAVVIVAVWLIRRLMLPNDIRVTRVGVFIERERYDDEEPAEEWPKEDTVELPPHYDR